jgi:hypothetical protein
MPNMKKPAPKSGPMRRPTMADRIQDAKNIQPKGPAKPNATKKAPATGMKITAKKAAAKPTSKPKPKGLNDYLDKGQTPPSKNKKLPSDADVILKGYNDKKTIAKSKASKKKKGM